MNMEAKLWFMVLCGLAVLLSYLAGFWRRKTAAAAFAAARAAATAKERDRYCRLAVLAGHREACLMFCFARSDFFEDHQPLKPFKSHGIKVAFYGYYYPSRYADLIDDEQRAFCCSLYQFKEGENHGIEFFKACMSVLQHPVYAVQRRVQVCPAIQTARLVHHNPPAGPKFGLI